MDATTFDDRNWGDLVNPQDGRINIVPDADHIGIFPTWRLDDEFPGRAWANECVTVNGWGVHACAFRLKRDEAGAQVAWSDVFEREVDALQDICGSVLEEVRLPGLEGVWTICLHGYGD